MPVELKLIANIKDEILRTSPPKDLTLATFPTSIIPPTTQVIILRFELRT